ncbi:hypothetical protein EHS13_29885 [Paenibacillus psychroresistens]|uniref:Uncharacterized protein n=1 Tax=Paenibacillus psychroresistens TaxID=1778678 RepID=A0A6B8RSA8_9BACL|nr:hypothetical protein [Paenibacillus psychroresistens]QGQ98787.1 hypothetical protein EHS13_29885 [Paenibacillus psychroresistens]
MNIFGLLIPSFRKGTYVVVKEATCIRGKEAELLFQHLDPANKYARNLYGFPKRGSKGIIVALIKYKNTLGSTSIYYGVLIKETLYAFEEKDLVRA